MISPNLSKPLHAVSKDLNIRFTPRTITIANQQRFLFSKKEAEPSEPNSASEETPEIPENERLLQEKIIELEEKNSDTLDKYKRSLADFENLRNRMNKQVFKSQF